MSPAEGRAMPQGWVWQDAQFVSCAGVPVTDRGFRYGMSVFESTPLRNGAFAFLREHLTRLQKACAVCNFAVALPPVAAWEKLSHSLDRTEGFARIYVTAGDGSVTGDAEQCRVLMFIEERTPIPASTYHQGYDLGMAPGVHAPLFGGLKTGNYWANLLAFRAGVTRQKNESLLWNQAGELISACLANVFVVLAGRVLTPPLASGARDGVLREWVLGRREVEEHALSAADVTDADEIFLTSSWLGVMSAASVEGRALPSRDIGSSLAREFRAG